MNVEVICEKSFSDVDGEIIDSFVEFQKALIDNSLDELSEILLDSFELINVFPQKQSKSDFLAMIDDGSLDYSKSDILEPTILWDDENTASLIADIRLTAKINGSERRWISKAVVSFKNVNGKWRIASWDN